MGAYTVNNGKIYGLMGFNKSSKLNDLDNATLNELEWNEIKYVIQSGKFGDYFSVGDTKDITLNLESGKYFSNAVSGTYKVVVLGIDHNSELEGTNRVHFCIGQDANGKEIAFNGMVMNPTAHTNSGGWNGCPMRTWLNNTLINGLPSDLTSVITPCTKYTNNTGSSNVESAITSTSDKLWLLSEFEVFGTITYANQYEKDKQAQYDYYKNGASKVRYQHYSTDSASVWWLRSAFCQFSTDFCVIDNGGANGYGAAHYLGVVPGFTIS